MISNLINICVQRVFVSSVMCICVQGIFISSLMCFCVQAVFVSSLMCICVQGIFVFCAMCICVQGACELQQLPGLPGSEAEGEVRPDQEDERLHRVLPHAQLHTLCRDKVVQHTNFWLALHSHLQGDLCAPGDEPDGDRHQGAGSSQDVHAGQVPGGNSLRGSGSH